MASHDPSLTSEANCSYGARKSGSTEAVPLQSPAIHGYAINPAAGHRRAPISPMLMHLGTTGLPAGNVKIRALAAIASQVRFDRPPQRQYHGDCQRGKPPAIRASGGVGQDVWSPEALLFPSKSKQRGIPLTSLSEYICLLLAAGADRQILAARHRLRPSKWSKPIELLVVLFDDPPQLGFPNQVDQGFHF